MSLEVIRRERRSRWDLIIIVIVISFVVNLLASLAYDGLTYPSKLRLLLLLPVLLILFVIFVFKRVYANGSSIEKRFRAVIGWNSNDQKVVKQLWEYRLCDLVDRVLGVEKDTFSKIGSKATDSDSNVEQERLRRLLVLEYALFELWSGQCLFRPGYDGSTETLDIVEDQGLRRNLRLQSVYMRKDSLSTDLESVPSETKRNGSQYFSLEVPSGATCKVRRHVGGLKKTVIDIKHKFFHVTISFFCASGSAQMVGLHPVVALIPLPERKNCWIDFYQFNIEGTFDTWVFLTPRVDYYYQWVESFVGELEASVSWDYFATFLPTRSEVGLRQLVARALSR